MHPAKNGGITLPAPQNALKGHRTSFFLQLPTQIPVSFALPFQLKLSRTHTLFLQLVLVLLARFWRATPKHLIESVADRVRSGFMVGAICPKITPGNPRQALLDLVGVQLLGLPPCGGAQGSQPGADSTDSSGKTTSRRYALSLLRPGTAASVFISESGSSCRVRKT